MLRRGTKSLATAVSITGSLTLSGCSSADYLNIASDAAGDSLILSLLGVVSLAVALGGLWHRFQKNKPNWHGASLGTLELTNDGEVLFANERALELLETDQTQLVGRSIQDFVSKDQWQRLRSDDESQDDGQPIELQLLTATQRKRWVLIVLSEPAVTGGRSIHPNRILQFCDASNQLAKQSRFRGRALMHKKLLEQSHDLFIVLDDESRIVEANDAARGLMTDTAQKNAGVHGVAIAEFAAPGDRERLAKEIAECQSLRSVRTLKSLLLFKARATGTKPVYVDAKLVPYRLDGENMVALCANSVNGYVTNEKALRTSTRRFSKVFQESPDAIALLRQTDTKFLDFNPGFTRLLGYERQDAIDKSESDINLWADEEQRQAVAERLNSEQEYNENEVCLRRVDGSIVKADLSIRQMTIDGEECLLIIARDVTARIKNEAARIESEEKFALVFQHSPDGIAIIRKRDGMIYDINDVLTEGSEYTKEELIGKSLLELNMVANPEAFVTMASKLQENGHYDAVEMQFISKNGGIVPTLVSANEFELSGEMYIIAIAKDMREVRRVEKQLEISEQRFKGSFDNAPIGIFLVDEEGKIFQANRFAQEMLVYEASELPNMHISRLVPTEDRLQLKETLTRLQLGTEKTSLSERRMLCQNGLELWTNCQIVLQRDGDSEYFIIQVADVTDIKLSQRRMERMAFYDTLTDLANRRLFQDRLAQAIDHCSRKETTAALLYLDLDQFKRVNDTLGHEAGDNLLRQVANRLTECVRTEDTVGRPGGDEFTILLFDVASPSDAGVVAEKILERLREPITISGHNLVVTTSIGITVLPTDGKDANILMKNADLAMYRAKERGRNNYQFFREEMNTNAIKRLRIENELREALEQEEFVLYYQPKVDIALQRMIGVESLIRWNHPKNGLLPPGEFIDVAEETGAIVEIGNWIIQEACRAGRKLREAGGDDFTTAINISPRQFRDPNLVNFIRKCLRESKLDPSNLEIEITETMLMHDVEAASETVQRLHKLGVNIAIDDFGTGYSSLNYLKKFPIQTVKVDRSFVMDIPSNQDDMAITAAVIAMAHRLNMQVVAEGVETRAQLKFLHENDCEYAQGYLFSKPEPLDEVMTILNRRKVKRTPTATVQHALPTSANEVNAPDKARNT